MSLCIASLTSCKRALGGFSGSTYTNNLRILFLRLNQMVLPAYLSFCPTPCLSPAVVIMHVCETERVCSQLLLLRHWYSPCIISILINPSSVAFFSSPHLWNSLRSSNRVAVQTHSSQPCDVALQKPVDVSFLLFKNKAAARILLDRLCWFVALIVLFTTYIWVLRCFFLCHRDQSRVDQNADGQKIPLILG